MNVTEKDILLNDILDGEQIEQPWGEWIARAETDPTMWRQLAEAQRDQMALMRTLNQTSAMADNAHATSDWSDVSTEPAMDSFGNVGVGNRAWMGWAVAAVVVIIAGLARFVPQNNQAVPATPVVTAQHAGWSPEQYLQRYLQQGKKQGTVIGELPQRVLIDARPSATGIGYDVVFLRQIQERQTVPDLYEVTGQDDAGQVQLVGYEPPSGGAM